MRFNSENAPERNKLYTEVGNKGGVNEAEILNEGHHKSTGIVMDQWESSSITGYCHWPVANCHRPVDNCHESVNQWQLSWISGNCGGSVGIFMDQ